VNESNGDAFVLEDCTPLSSQPVEQKRQKEVSVERRVDRNADMFKAALEIE